MRTAYILDDPKLKEIAQARLGQVVNGVNNGGETFIWWEPASVLQVIDGDPRFDQFTRNFNNWAHSHMGRALVAYYRATGEARILKALTKVYAGFPLHALPKDQFVPHGGAANLDPMLETYALSGERRILEKAMAFAGSEAFGELIRKWGSEPLPPGHTVLYYEHARVPALTYPWTGNEEALKASRRVLELGLHEHGLPVGLASGQEHLMGRGSIRGLETCTVVASAWTNKWMLQVTGKRQYADQMEEAILNAGPAAVSRDFDSACYFQTMNRIDSVVPLHTIRNIEGYGYSKTAGPTLCCISNLTRMIPCYVQHMWMATLDGGLAATLYGPNQVQSTVGDNQTVQIVSATNYPFDSDIVMTVRPQRPVKFPLYLRIPGWCDNPSVELNDAPASVIPEPSGFLKLERQWTRGDRIRLRLAMKVEVEQGKTTAVPDTAYFKRPNRATPITRVKKFGQPYAAVHYGPLLFALPLPDETPNRARPGTRWQYALNVKPEEASARVRVVRADMPDRFQWPLEAPLTLQVPAVYFDWNPNNTQPLPDEPVDGGKDEWITLVPYGCTKFRVSMFPVSKTMVNQPAGRTSVDPATAR